MSASRAKTKPPLVISSEKRKRARLVFDESPCKRAKRSYVTDSGRETGSPEPNCPICLGRMEGKCYAHGCFHSFCKTCLSEWAKVKAECPVCREPFDKIIFNVRALDMYDEVAVPPRPSPAASLFAGMGLPDMYPASFSTNFNHMLMHHFYQQHMPPAAHTAAASIAAAAAASPPFTATASSTYRNPHTLPASPGISLSTFSIQIDTDSSSSIVVHSGPRRSGRRAASAATRELGLGVSVEDMFRPMLRLNPVPARPGTMEFRRHIYRADLWVKFPFRESRRRECSAQFYRANAAVTFRLHEFIRRDLRVIIRTAHEVSLLHQMIVAALTTDDIRSRSFRRLVENYTQTNTDHFIHELFCFAISPIESVDEYDRRAEYVNRNETRVHTTTPAVPPLGYMYELDADDRSTVLTITLSSEDESDGDDDQHFAPNPLRHAASASATVTSGVSHEAPDVSRTPDLIEVVDVIPDVNEERLIEESVPGEEQVFSINVNFIDDFDNPTAGPSGINTSIVLPINLTQDPDSDSDTDIDVGQDAGPEGRYRSRGVHFDDDEDEVEVVGTVKARHDRTPEIFDLSDDEDERKESHWDRQKREVESVITGLKSERVEAESAVTSLAATITQVTNCILQADDITDAAGEETHHVQRNETATETSVPSDETAAAETADPKENK